MKDWSCEGEPKFLDSFAVDPFRAADDPFNDGSVEDRSVETSFNVCSSQSFEISFCGDEFSCTSN